MLTTESVCDFGGLDAIAAEWSELHRRARPGSPFEHPAWAATWARRFVPEDRLECVAVRDADRDGALVGFAPFYRRTRLTVAGARATSIQPLGTGRRESLTEVVQVLCLPDRAAEVLRAVARHLEALPSWNWLQLSLSPDQGWMVPQWFGNRAEYAILHRTVRPCVVVHQLPATEAQLWSGLKRNVRESVRRGRNRSKRLGGVSFRCESTGPPLAEALRNLESLHRQRSQLAGKTAHGDKLSRPEDRLFLVDAVTRLAADGLARVHLAAHDGRDVAALLVLSDGDTDYVSVTGLDPAYWDLSLNTVLIYQAMLAAVGMGRSRLNLSTGPDADKLRWSSTISTFNDFTVVREDLWSRMLYGAYFHLSVAMSHREERLRHRIKT